MARWLGNPVVFLKEFVVEPTTGASSSTDQGIRSDGSSAALAAPYVSEVICAEFLGDGTLSCAQRPVVAATDHSIPGGSTRALG